MQSEDGIYHMIKKSKKFFAYLIFEKNLDLSKYYI